MPSGQGKGEGEASDQLLHRELHLPLGVIGGIDQGPSIVTECGNLLGYVSV